LTFNFQGKAKEPNRCGQFVLTMAMPLLDGSGKRVNGKAGLSNCRPGMATHESKPCRYETYFRLPTRGQTAINFHGNGVCQPLKGELPDCFQR
jgi:hypothetical protein